MALSEGKKESLPNAQDLQTVCDSEIGPHCELPNFIGTLSKHISGLFQVVSSLPVSESLLQAPSAAFLGRSRQGEPSEISEK